MHPGGTPLADLDPRVEFVVADVTAPKVGDSLLAETRPDVVLHLDAETGTARDRGFGSMR